MLRRSSGGAPVLCWHTQQDTAIAVRHEVDRLGAAGSASNESRSLDHLLLMHTLVGAQWRRVQPHRSRTLREPTTVFTGACRRVVAVLPSWAWLREPAGRTGVAALALR